MLAAAILLLIYTIAHALLLRRFPWFVDETFYAFNAQAGAGDPAHRFDALVDHKGLIIQWIAIVLIHLRLAPMDAMRIISIGSGIVAAAAAGVIVWRWWGDVVLGLATSAVVAFIPYFFVHDSVGIYDPFVAAFSMVALVLQLELVRRRRLDLAMILGGVLGVLVLAKPTGVLAIVLIPFSLLAMDWSRQGRNRRLAAWAGLIVLSLVIAGAIWSLSRLSPLAFTPAPANHRTLSEFLHDPFRTLPAIAPGVWDAMWGYLTPAGVILSIWGLARVIVERHRAGIVVAIWALSALAAYLLLTDNAFPRYGLQAVAPLCILAVVGAADLVRRIAPRVRGNSSHTRAWRIGAALLVLAAVGPGLVLDLRVLANPGNAPYPGLDRSQYNVLISNTGPDENAANEILRLSPPSVTDTSPAAERTVAESGGWGSWTAHLVLNGRTYTPHPRFNFIDLYGGSPDQNLANAARFVIVDGAAPPGWFKLGRARLVGQWTRPGGGVPVQLYERG